MYKCEVLVYIYMYKCEVLVYIYMYKCEVRVSDLYEKIHQTLAPHIYTYKSTLGPLQLPPYTAPLYQRPLYV